MVAGGCWLLVAACDNIPWVYLPSFNFSMFGVSAISSPTFAISYQDDRGVQPKYIVTNIFIPKSRFIKNEQTEN